MEVAVRLNDAWAWRRWQLVRVEEEHDVGVVVDVIELTDEAVAAEGGLVTLTFDGEPDHEEDEPLCQRFERWAEQEDGVCDAFYRPQVATGYLVMFQGSDSVVLPTRIIGP
jgi:hypothetical protein